MEPNDRHCVERSHLGILHVVVEFTKVGIFNAMQAILLLCEYSTHNNGRTKLVSAINCDYFTKVYHICTH